MSVDTTGKVNLDHIYTQTDPRGYFRTLGELDYCLPQLAKPYFLRLFHAYAQAYGRKVERVLDIGCSYGINAALLKCDATMSELHHHYVYLGAQLSREAVLDRDREMVRSRNRLPDTRFVGLDVSRQALEYAHAAGLIDDVVSSDLEREAPDSQVQNQLADCQLVMSTGCVGYVTERTITRVVSASTGQRPWLANFVLRMYPFGPIDAALSKLGYQTRPLNGLLKQRRFASTLEQAQILDRLSDVGIDPTGREREGWLYARLYVSRPLECTGTPALASLFSGA